MAEDNDDDDDLGGGTPNTVPYARFYKVNQQKRQANADIKQRDATIAELKATLGERDTTIQSFAEVQADLDRYKGLEGGWAMEKAIMTSGITDPDAVEFAQLAYARLPADERPKVTEWLSEDNRDKLSAPVRRALFGAEQADTQRKVVDPDRGVTRAPNGKGDASRLRAADMNSENIKSVWESMGIKPPEFPKA